MFLINFSLKFTVVYCVNCGCWKPRASCC